MARPRTEAKATAFFWGRRRVVALCSSFRRPSKRVGHGRKLCCTASRAGTMATFPTATWCSTKLETCMEQRCSGAGKGTSCNPFYPYCGTVFELSPPKQKGGKWTEKVLHSFAGVDKGGPPGD